MRIRWKRYLSQLDIGESIDPPESVKTLQSLRTIISRYNKQHESSLFSVRLASAGKYKIWRVR